MAFDQQCFSKPDPTYGIYQIIHSGVVNGDRAARDYQDRGYAGIVGNLPYTRSFPMDTEAWEATRKGFQAFLDRGMHVWIYDENGYPSGTAGGAVIEADPGLEAEGLYCYEYWRTLTGPCEYRADVPGDTLYCALLLPLEGGDPLDVTSCQNAAGTLYLDIPEGNFHLFTMSIRHLFDGTHAAESYSEPRKYISLNDRKATETFLQMTHEHYAAILGEEFGRGVRAFFTDEPSLISWNIRQAVYPIVPWHHTFPEAFQARYGYPISLAVMAVVTKRGLDVPRRRCDFWEFVGEGVAASYFGAIQEWCHAHGTKSSGHMLEEERLSAHVINYGSLYKCLKRMDWPGIDQLDSEPQKLMERETRLPIARLIASFADINGEHEAFTEFSAHTSYMENKQIGIDWVRASVNWHFAMGINNFTSYYDLSVYSREEEKALNLYTARLGYLLRLGRRDSQVALLYPEATIWAAYTPQIGERAMDHSPETVQVDSAFRSISWDLLERQVDYDYVDETLLQEARICQGSLCYRDRRYSTIVLPGVRVLGLATMEKLAQMTSQGIFVLCMTCLPTVCRDGDETAFQQLLHTCQESPYFAHFEGYTLPGQIKIPQLHRPYQVTPDYLGCVLTGAEGSGKVIDGEVLSTQILSHSRLLEDESRIVFLTNMGSRTYEGKLKVAEKGQALLASPATGEVTPTQGQMDAQFQILPVRLRPYEALAYIMMPGSKGHV